jgi:hypothetical protein
LHQLDEKGRRRWEHALRILQCNHQLLSSLHNMPEDPLQGSEISLDECALMNQRLNG